MEKKCIIEMKEGERLYKTKLNALNEPVIREITCEPYTEPNMEQVKDEAYQRGLADAWEAARKLLFNKSSGGIGFNAKTIKEAFGVSDDFEVLRDYSPAEAIEKIRAYEQEQDESEESKKELSVTTEEVMRQYLDTFCNKKRCKGCPLDTSDFTCGRGYHFLTKSCVSDEEVRRAYATVLQKMKEN